MENFYLSLLIFFPLTTPVTPASQRRHPSLLTAPLLLRRITSSHRKSISAIKAPRFARANTRQGTLQKTWIGTRIGTWNPMWNTEPDSQHEPSNLAWNPEWNPRWNSEWNPGWNSAKDPLCTMEPGPVCQRPQTALSHPLQPVIVICYSQHQAFATEPHRPALCG